MKEEAKKRAGEAERKLERTKLETEQMKKEGRLPTPAHSNTPPITPVTSTVITSLDEASVIFPQIDNIKREGNLVINHGSIYS